MIFSQLLYILQSEHYDWKRFFSFAYSHLNWFNLQKRGKIDWTLRAKILFILSILLFILDAYYFVFIDINDYIILFYAQEWFTLTLGVINLILVILSAPIHLVIADFLISPLVTYKKNKILKSAKKLIENIRKNNSDFITIGITGSYGKTTIKTILHSLLSQKYNVFLVPGNINTDIGVANYLLKNKEIAEKSDIILLEMGAFCIGEIASICDVIQPDYSFLTAIGNQHLERFGSHENIKKAKFEIVEATQKKAFINISNENIKNYLAEFTNTTKNKKCEIIEANTETNTIREISNITFLDNFSGIQFEYFYKNANITLETKLIADHIISSIAFCLQISEELQLSEENIIAGIKNLNHVPHRLEVIHNKQTGVTVIDDSYNGNFDGFLSGLKTLSRAKGRKIVLTPGIVELGKDAKSTHAKLAELYPQYIDVLLVIINKNTNYMLECLQEKQSETIEVLTYPNAFNAHEELKNVLKKGDTILFQNDLSDNY